MKIEIRASLNKYNNLSIEKKSTIWFSLSSVIRKGISIIAIPVFTRLLTTEQYGLLTLYLSSFPVLFIICTLNLSSGIYYNALSEYKNDWDEMTLSFQSLSAVSTIIIMTFLCILNFYDGLSIKIPSVLISFMLFELLFEQGYKRWINKKTFLLDYKKVFTVSVFESSIGFVFTLFLVIVSPKEFKSIARVLGCVFFPTLLGLIFCFRNIWKVKKIYSTKYWNYALSHTFPLIPHELSLVVLDMSDRLMIGYLVGTAEAAIYGMAYNIASLLILFVNAANGVFLASTFSLLEKKDYERINTNVKKAIITVGISVTWISLLGPDIINILPDDYAYSKWAIPPIAASVFFRFLYPLFVNVEQYFLENKKIMIASLSIACLNILLNYCLIPKMGYLVAGYTTLICYILITVLHYFFYRSVCNRFINGSHIYSGKLVVIFSIIVIALSAFVILLYNCTVARYVTIIISTLVGGYYIYYVNGKKEGKND